MSDLSSREKYIASLICERDKLRERVEYLEAERVQLVAIDKSKTERVKELDHALFVRSNQLTTATEDFNTTWEALMELEGKYATAAERIKKLEGALRGICTAFRVSGDYDGHVADKTPWALACYIRQAEALQGKGENQDD